MFFFFRYPARAEAAPERFGPSAANPPTIRLAPPASAAFDTLAALRYTRRDEARETRGTAVDYPKLRSIEAVPVQQRGRVLVHLYDPTRLSDRVVVVPQELMYLISMFDGTNSVVDMQAALMRRFGELVFSHKINEVINQLDEALLLHSERFEAHLREVKDAFRRIPVRRACSAGSGYPLDPKELAAQLHGYFTAEGGPGLPRPGTGQQRMVGLVAPHIDFERGGLSYAHAYKALAEDCDADLFLVFGTAHFAPEEALYILTRKSFETPFGTLRTNEELVDAVARRYGREPFAEELVHKTEHSIEFQVVLLQHVLKDRPIEMVPILCNSMDERVGEAASPGDVAEVSEFLDAVRDVVAGSGRRVCAIAGADLTHVGRQFGDEFPITPQLLKDVERADREALAHVERLDGDAFYDSVRADDNARHICGVPPIYALLATTDAERCELLDYRQAPDSRLQRAVTFASLAFYA